MERSRNLQQVFLYVRYILPVIVIFTGLYFLVQILPYFILVVFGVALSFVLFFIADVIARRKFDIKQFVEDLRLARHILIVWFIVTFLDGYLLFLQLLRKLKVHINGKIPEGKWIAAGNHPDLMLRDVFVVPIKIFFLKWKYFLNPLKWFPRTVADVNNYIKSWFFQVIGDVSLVGIDRGNGKSNGKNNSRKNRRTWKLFKPLEFVKNFRDNGGIQIFNIEAGRTTTAINTGEFETVVVGEDILVMGKPTPGAAWLSKLTDAPIVPYFIRIKGGALELGIKDFLATRSQSGEQTEPFFKNPKASPSLGWRGWIQLLIDPRLSMELDIGLPTGPLMPIKEESLEEYTQRLYRAIFEVGKIQLQRSKKH